MSDIYSKKKRSELMSHIRSKNTKPEIALRKIISSTIYSHGFRYRLKKGQKLSRKYWLPKIERNIRRDMEVNRLLKKLGWKVVRVWEHELNKRPEKVLDSIMKVLN